MIVPEDAEAVTDRLPETEPSVTLASWGYAVIWSVAVLWVNIAFNAEIAADSDA